MKLSKESNHSEESDSDSYIGEMGHTESNQEHNHTDHSYVKSDELIIGYEAKLDALKKQFEKEKTEQKEKFERMKFHLKEIF